MAIAAAACGRGCTSMQESGYSPDKNYKFCKVSLTPCQQGGSICGKVSIQIKHFRSLEVIKPSWRYYYAMVVELECIIYAKSCGIVKASFNPLSPSDNELFYGSVVRQVLEGDESTMNIKCPGAEPPYQLIAEDFEGKFALKLSPSLSLPPTMRGPNLDVTYNLVVRLRTQDGYETIEKKEFNFFGFHAAAGLSDSFLNEGKGPLLLSVLRPNYKPDEQVPFTLTLTGNMRPKSTLISILKQVSYFVEGHEAVSTSEIDKIVFKKQSSNEVSGKLVLKREGKTILPPSYNSGDKLIGLRIQYFLNATVTFLDGQEFCVRKEINVCTTSASGPLSAEAVEVSYNDELPTYSQLSSRRPSTETLPPNYQDI